MNIVTEDKARIFPMGVMVPKDEYNALIEAKTRLDVIVSCATKERYNLSKETIFTLAGRTDLIAKEEE